MAKKKTTKRKDVPFYQTMPEYHARRRRAGRFPLPLCTMALADLIDRRCNPQPRPALDALAGVLRALDPDDRHVLDAILMADTEYKNNWTAVEADTRAEYLERGRFGE